MTRFREREHLVEVCDDSFRFGFESALELCILESKKCRSKTEAVALMESFLDAVKNDKIDRLKDMIARVKHC